ncbi:hypothetical protein NSERUTF1_3959 [Nocardia seriolae]|nr:hypothetical protein NSERUTF1_3959 [Nocardia seriolae]
MEFGLHGLGLVGVVLAEPAGNLFTVRAHLARIDPLAGVLGRLPLVRLVLAGRSGTNSAAPQQDPSS